MNFFSQYFNIMGADGYSQYAILYTEWSVIYMTLTAVGSLFVLTIFGFTPAITAERQMQKNFQTLNKKMQMFAIRACKPFSSLKCLCSQWVLLHWKTQLRVLTQQRTG